MEMTLDHQFQQYFAALDRAGHEDRCFLCRRAPADVKAFFGFHEDGTPIDAEKYGIEDVVLDPRLDIMSYRGSRPVCAVCQLNLDSILLGDEGATLRQVLWELEHEREKLWSNEGESETTG
jgi:PP-loop superfamily ATP-utilizing enzyme